MTILIFDVGDKTSYIDKNVYEYIVNKYPGKWSISRGYLITHKGQNFYYIHKLVFEALGENIYDNLEVDHIDRNKLNNTKDNLRLVTGSINCYNRNKINKKTTSKYVGVYWEKYDKRFRSQIYIKGKRKCLGLYDDAVKAAYAYDFAKKNLLKIDDIMYNNVANLLDEKTKEKIEKKVLSKN